MKAPPLALLHPLLLTLFPIIFLFAQNRPHVSTTILLPTFALALPLTLAAWATAFVATRNSDKAALLTSLFLLLFFGYGHFLNLFPSSPDQPAGIRRSYLTIAWVLPFLAAMVAVLRVRRGFHPATIFMTVFAAVTVAPPAGLLALDILRPPSLLRPPPIAATQDLPPTAAPDIYYIILDGYARSDILSQIYDYDNSDFTQQLAQMGFYVAHRSRANYSLTHLSLASSLNMMYIQDLVAPNDDLAWTSTAVIERLHHSSLLSFLKARSYTFVAFATGFYSTEMPHADVYVQPPMNISDFNATLLRTTPISLLWNALPLTPYDHHRDRILFTLRQVANLASIPSPIFVYAHVGAPHRPFVFGLNGEPLSESRPFTFEEGPSDLGSQEYIRRYAEQLHFLNSLVIETVRTLRERPGRPRVIIVQSDHGPASFPDWDNPRPIDLSERMGILNALYLPDHTLPLLYDTMSPVNTFRAVLNQYFGTQLEMQQDRSYFSPIRQPSAFIDVNAILGR